MTSERFPLLRSLAVLSLIVVLPILVAAGDNWKPIGPADLALKAPIVEKDADAEALFWEVWVNDDPQGDLILNHYVRIKVFTDRGRESQSKIDIPFGTFSGREIKINDIAARTIRPDGSIVELKSADVFERAIVKTSGLKVKVKSFAMPALEAGCIIEYRWREVRVNQSANYVRLEFQRDIPVHRVTYFVKPYPFPGLAMSSITMHANATEFKKAKEGFYSTTMENVPAIHEESRMPPEDQVKSWILLYYTKDEKIEAEKYWFDYGKRVYQDTKSLLKVNDDVRQMTASLTEGAKTDDEKIERLFNFCRTKIKNVSDDASGLTAEERKKLKENKSPADTLKRQSGNGADIDLLFAALATAAGYDARIVLAPNRGDLFFNKAIPNSYFLEPSNIAVRIGDQWKFYNPGFNHVPVGMLRWQEEGTQALVTDPKQPEWTNIPMSPPEKSHVKRVARLKLSEDGTLEGDVEINYSGHFAIDKKEESDEETASQREAALKEEIKARMSTAELSGIRIENISDFSRPLVHGYHIRIPGYAQRTGKRLFLQPAVFQHGAAPLFSASERKYQVYFHYPWSESDEVVIDLPQGYSLDNADAPAGFGSSEISEYKPAVSVTTDGRTLIFKRQFFFGGGGNILFPVTAYAQLKAYFDQLHKQDSHAITLKQSAAAASSN
jgi:transglutaminase-like putative cysteine protease